MAEVPDGSRFCGTCGASVGEAAADAPTRTSAPSALPTELAASVSSPSSSSSADQGRFLPGTVLDKRYRIIALLGRGGMGEVYRADDLKLGRSVALKFLPQEMERDEGRLGRFLNEVRMALEVTHANVTRVHDIGEVDGYHYISMEYVDGEDLSSLLRRIGRLPKDKAVQVARQICAGLAAAHDQGVLHRDLKPANVMLDGRGQVKITDFGLAGLEETIEGAEAQAGTPAYMAPEQWAGKEVSAQSDIYALGVVLYELFTGQPVFVGKSPAEILKIQQEGSASVTSPSTVIEGFDPAVERVIFKCLERDPGERPKSALAVSAALPGGDPLAAALAAGETPSPEIVAQAGGTKSVSPKVAIGLLTAAVLMLAVWLSVASQFQFIGFVKTDKSPDVLIEKAQQIIRDLGYEEPPLDSLFDFAPNRDYQRHISESDSSPDRWNALRVPQPAAMRFRYRQAPEYISKFNGATIGQWMEDPPADVPGEVVVELDLEGRLLSFRGVPPEQAHPNPSSSDSDMNWEPLLKAAGFEAGDLMPRESLWLPPFYADSRAAWTGVYPDAGGIEIRVEAAAFDGRPVAMRILEPWSTSREEASADRRERRKVSSIFRSAVPFSILSVAIFIAWRNVRLGRGDRQTAIRFALYMGVIRLLWMLGAHHVPAQEEAGVIFGHLAHSAFRVFVALVFYLAVEPYARRLWPHILVTWMRFVGGKWRDPVVGRDILVGLVLGAGLPLIFWFRDAVFNLLTGLPGAAPLVVNSTLESLRGGRHLVAALAMDHNVALILNTLMMVLMLVILRLLLRRTGLAVVGLMVLSAGAGWPAWSSPLAHLLFVPIVVGLGLFGLFRFGFLTVAVAMTFGSFLRAIPMTPDTSSWYFGSTLLVSTLFLGLAVYAFRISIADRRMPTPS
jgi:serine/threonine protein kinase